MLTPLLLALTSGALLEGASGESAVAPAAPQDTPRILQVRAAEMVLADGSRVENGVLVVENGKITRVGRGVELDERLPTLEHDGVLTAGLVACQTRSGRSREMHDDTRAFLPEAQVVHAFDPDHSDFAKACAAGITSLVLVPSPENVVGGRTAVVKSAGGRVVKDEGHLALSFSKEGLSTIGGGFRFFFGSVRPTEAEGGAESTASGVRGSRAPTSYPGAIRALDEAFGSGEGVFGRAARGELPVLVAASDRNEVDRALRFLKRHGLRGAVHGAPRAGELVSAFADAGIGVVLGPFDNGQTRPSLESVGQLAAAGVPVAFALDGPDHSPERFRYSAALAITAGAEPAQVMRALTSDAARIANVADTVGSLERGRDADFVLWSGDPLDLTSRVVAVFIDGERVHGETR